MKLKSFLKVCTTVDIRYTVTDKNSGDVVELFRVNYLDKDVENLKKQILKRMEYEKKGATITNVDCINGNMHIDIEV